MMMNRQEINNKFADILDRKENKNKTCVEIVVDQDLEIERLNNIINEFDKWLNNIPNYFMDKRSNNTGVYIQKGMQQMIEDCKSVIEQLKKDDTKWKYILKILYMI